MENIMITAEEKKLILEVFKNIRNNLKKYMTDRNFIMSNAQIFTFLLYAPVCLAIASDGEVDEKEIAILEKITKNIDVNSAVNLDLLELISIAPEPSNIMLNEEFNMRVDAELLYLSRNMNKYEKDIIEAVKNLLKLDRKANNETSLKSIFNKWFDFIIEKNAGKNKEEELKKVEQYKIKLGL
jgi:predicted thioredoxin/glutaredoxin